VADEKTVETPGTSDAGDAAIGRTRDGLIPLDDTIDGLAKKALDEARRAEALAEALKRAGKKH